MTWMIVLLLLVACLAPVGFVCLRGNLIDRLVGLEMAGVLMAQIGIIWAVAMQRPALADVGLAVGVLAFGSGLVFARFLERWL